VEAIEVSAAPIPFALVDQLDRALHEKVKPGPRTRSDAPRALYPMRDVLRTIGAWSDMYGLLSMTEARELRAAAVVLDGLLQRFPPEAMAVRE